MVVVYGYFEVEEEDFVSVGEIFVGDVFGMGEFVGFVVGFVVLDGEFFVVFDEVGFEDFGFGVVIGVVSV